MHSFFSRLCHTPILRLAAITLVTLAWSGLAFCGEIHKAAWDGDLEKVKALLKDNPDLVFSKDKVENTPLHLAAVRGHKDVMKFLVASKADVNAKNISGKTPLYSVALSGHKDMVELLLANKADVNVKDMDGNTPLNYVALSGRKDIVELLLANKADVNTKDNKGQTPLHKAVFSRNKDVAELLRQHGGQE